MTHFIKTCELCRECKKTKRTDRSKSRDYFRMQFWGEPIPIIAGCCTKSYKLIMPLYHKWWCLLNFLPFCSITGHVLRKLISAQAKHASYVLLCFQIRHIKSTIAIITAHLLHALRKLGCSRFSSFWNICNAFQLVMLSTSSIGIGIVAYKVALFHAKRNFINKR